MSNATDTMQWLVNDWRGALDSATSHRLNGALLSYNEMMAKADRLWEQIVFLRDRNQPDQMEELRERAEKSDRACSQRMRELVRLQAILDEAGAEVKLLRTVLTWTERCECGTCQLCVATESHSAWRREHEQA